LKLKYRVAKLDDVPESAREFYVEDGDGYRLEADGLEQKDTTALENALERLKREKRELKAKLDGGANLSPEDAEELNQLRADARQREEDEAKKAGKWDEVRAKLQKDHDRDLAAERAKTQAEAEKNARRDRRLIRDSLAAQIARVGAKKEYFDAVEAMIERSHKLDVQWGEGDDVQVVVVDEVHGDKSLADWMGEWAKSDAANPFMPVETGSGGGGGGDEGAGRGKSWQGKKFSEMSDDEQVAYTEEKYGSGAAA